MASLEVQFEIMALTAIGFVLGRKGVLSQETCDQLIDLLFMVIMPASIIQAFEVEFAADVISQVGMTFCISCGIQLFYWCWNQVFYRRSDDGHRCCMRYATMVSNAALIGMPVASAYLGQRGLMLAAIFLIPHRVLMWSYGLSMFADGEDKRGMLGVMTHPCVLATIFGFAVMILYGAGLELPGIFASVVSALSGCSTALGMMIIGVMLSGHGVRGSFDRETLVFSAYRLLVIPVIVAGALYMLSLDALPAQVCILLTGMPAASTTAILARKYDKDAAFASQLVMVSTLLSVATIPLLHMIVTALW
ncbi:AEC family transporter [uncultured Collinsella sp.]|uniref:AEC family transporter n=1 Tax=uncultured Collinsella sp. TaxID=165190 RepID=UPI0025D7C5FF|nr:AEC family transporter [uncultured Collinsella sp.]